MLLAIGMAPRLFSSEEVLALLEPEEDCELDDTQELIMEPEGSNEDLVTWIKWKMVISLLISSTTLF